MSTTPRHYNEQTKGLLQQDNDSHRLPCRGCTRDCGNYSRCQGTPWRMQGDGTIAQPHHMHTP